MNLDDFIIINRIQPADAIIVKKNFIGLLNHYLIYLGRVGNEHKFIANYTKGTRILTYSELNYYLEDFVPDKIRRFVGNDFQRNTAVQRALLRKDQTSYHLLFNNCEHFANYVQTGKDASQQTTTFGTTLALAGLVTAAASKKDETKGLGVAMAVLGFLTLLIDED